MSQALIVAMALLSSVQSEIIAVFEYARHGARGPLHNIVKVDWIDKYGPEELTPNGMRQEYLLGMQMAHTYKDDIFNDKFTIDMLETSSTNFNRTIASAYSHVAGMVDQFNSKDLPFPNDDKRLQPPVLTIDPQVGFTTPLPNKFNPIPIHGRVNQRKLQPIKSTCPYGTKIAQESQKNVSKWLTEQPKIITMLEEAAAAYKIDAKAVNGRNTIDLTTCERLGDFAIQDYFNNPKAEISKTGTEEQQALYKQLEKCYSVAAMSRFNNSEFVQNIVSELLIEISTLMQKKLTDSKFGKKFFYYSGHDDMMTAILIGAGILDPSCIFEDLAAGTARPRCMNTPPLAASLVWELHRVGEAKEIEVYVKYNGEKVDFCGLLDDDKNYKCTWKQFQDRISALTNENWKYWCVNGRPDDISEEIQLWKIITYVCGGLCLLAVLMIVGVLHQLRSRTSRADIDNFNAINQTVSLSED